MSFSNPFQDARLFWTIRAGKLFRALDRMVYTAFRERFKPKGRKNVRNVEDLARGRTLALWVAATVADPEWAERFVTWTLRRDDPNVQEAIAEIHRGLTFGADEPPAAE